MGHLMGNRGGHVLLLLHRTTFGINQEVGIPKNNGARILHRSGREVRDLEQVEFLEWVLDVEIIVVETHATLGGLQRKPALFFLARRGPDVNGYSLGFAVNVL